MVLGYAQEGEPVSQLGYESVSQRTQVDGGAGSNGNAVRSSDR